MQHLVYSTILLFLLIFSACKKKNDPPQVPVETTDRVLTQNLSYPWEILWGPDNFIWITERGGRISRVHPTSGAVTPLLSIADVQSQNEGGLLGMALHPEFNTSPQVFVAYNYNNGGNYREKIVRYTYNGATLVSPVVLLDNLDAASIHNGSRLLIVNGKLFITTGDAGNSALAQNTSSLNGKILRINLDGSIPFDNPTPGSAIWTLGHRNTQGLVFANNILYSSEHGPSNDDEINIIQKGRNYGWPNVQGFCDQTSEQSFCSANNVREPLKVWTPTLAVCGLDYYDKDLIPQWKNSLLLCTLKGSRLLQLTLNGSKDNITNTTEFYQNSYGRLRDLCISPEGKVYLCTSNGGSDKIIEISRKEL